MSETRVYVINMGKAISTDLDNIRSIDNTQKFINEAERQGNIYSLEGFQEAWNDEEIPYDSYVKFINTEINTSKLVCAKCGWARTFTICPQCETLVDLKEEL